MPAWRIHREGRQIIVHSQGEICATTAELLTSSAFLRVVTLYGEGLMAQDSPMCQPFAPLLEESEDWSAVAGLLKMLADSALEDVVRQAPEWGHFQTRENRRLLNLFVQGLYDYWRSFDRFMVLHSLPGPSALDRRPYRAFNATIEELTHLVRAAYRDIAENITRTRPDVYRQVPAGCNMGFIAVPRSYPLPERYAELLHPVPVVRQVWMTPPMIIDPPKNTREGQFIRVDDDPLAGLSITPDEWLCYPVQVGPIVVFIYVHQRFMSLGGALANLFELATEAQIAEGPDAIYLYGVPPEQLERFGEVPTVFHEAEGGLLVAAVPGADRFGYFGYLKKMALTLHNIVAMKRGSMPYHGAMTRISLRSGACANILLIGDTATGKSESLEALRTLGADTIRELRIIADDMGSVRLDASNRLIGFGTEIGAFVRLDDLQQGYAYQQIDRAIIMSPHKINARVVLPVTTIEEVLEGQGIDFILYANNYEEVDDERGVLARFATPEEALAVFRAGAAMSKGTTASSGRSGSYFANIFGPPQYRDLHDPLAERIFEAAFDTGVFVGELRTRLGIPGFESEGPAMAAQALLEQVAKHACCQSP